MIKLLAWCFCGTPNIGSRFIWLFGMFLGLFLLLSCLVQPLYEGFCLFFCWGGGLCITTVLAVLKLTFIDQTGLSDALSYTILFCRVWSSILQHFQWWAVGFLQARGPCLSSTVLPLCLDEFPHFSCYETPVSLSQPPKNFIFSLLVSTSCLFLVCLLVEVSDSLFQLLRQVWAVSFLLWHVWLF